MKLNSVESSNYLINTITNKSPFFSQKQSTPNSRSHSICPNCHHEVQQLKYYGCCLEPACQGCYDQGHSIECKKGKLFDNAMMFYHSATQKILRGLESERSTKQFNHSKMNTFSSPTKKKSSPKKKRHQKRNNRQCSSCQTLIKDSIYICEQCLEKTFCQECFDKIHRSGKFSCHTRRVISLKNLAEDIENDNFEIMSHANKSTIESENSVVIKDSYGSQSLTLSESREVLIPKILLCSLHNKQRTILTQTLEIICPECSSQLKIRKPKPITESAAHIQSIKYFLAQIDEKTQSYQNKWSSLQSSIEKEYNTIVGMAKERYEYCMNILQKIKRMQNKILGQCEQTCQKVRIEMKLMGYTNTAESTNSSMSILHTYRLNIINQLLNKKIKVIKSSLDNFIHKISEVDKEKYEALLKAFCIQKHKPKEEQNNSSNANSGMSMSMRMSVNKQNNGDRERGRGSSVRGVSCSASKARDTSRNGSQVNLMNNCSFTSNLNNQSSRKSLLQNQSNKKKLNESRMSLKSITKDNTPKQNSQQRPSQTSKNRGQSINKQADRESSKPKNISTNKYQSHYNINNSSGKKSVSNMYKSMSFVCGDPKKKIEEIQPMELKFDANTVEVKNNKCEGTLKNSNTSSNTNSNTNLSNKINFLSQQLHQESQKTLEQSHSQTNSISTNLYNRPAKRKSDYYDLRQRMRKPSMVNNRFSRK